jgi:hypothetical protein
MVETWVTVPIAREGSLAVACDAHAMISNGALELFESGCVSWGIGLLEDGLEIRHWLGTRVIRWVLRQGAIHWIDFCHLTFATTHGVALALLNTKIKFP